MLGGSRPVALSSGGAKADRRKEAMIYLFIKAALSGLIVMAAS